MYKILIFSEYYLNFNFRILKKFFSTNVQSNRWKLIHRRCNKLSALVVTRRYLYAWRKLSSTLSVDSGPTYSNETFARAARYDKEIIQYTYQCIVIAIIRK